MYRLERRDCSAEWPRNRTLKKSARNREVLFLEREFMSWGRLERDF